MASVRDDLPCELAGRCSEVSASALGGAKIENYDEAASRRRFHISPCQRSLGVGFFIVDPPVARIGRFVVADLPHRVTRARRPPRTGVLFRRRCALHRASLARGLRARGRGRMELLPHAQPLAPRPGPANSRRARARARQGASALFGLRQRAGAGVRAYSTEAGLSVVKPRICAGASAGVATKHFAPPLSWFWRAYFCR